MSNFIRVKVAALVFLFALFGFAARQAEAVVIISNYPAVNSVDGSTIAILGGGFSKAAGFTLPAGTDYSLDSVTLRLDRNNADATIQVDLFGDAGGSPVGPALLSFIVPVFGLGVSDVVFLPATPFTLLASTTYWIGATGVSPVFDDSVDWQQSNPDFLPTGIATSAGYRFSSIGVYPPNGGSSIFNIYLVNATAVAAAAPEPGALLLLGALAFVRRKKS
ncbi:MAG: choice-of-anchor R domain-containing protein [Deltaproteobacteria bacterium]